MKRSSDRRGRCCPANCRATMRSGTEHRPHRHVAGGIRNRSLRRGLPLPPEHRVFQNQKESSHACHHRQPSGKASMPPPTTTSCRLLPLAKPYHCGIRPNASRHVRARGTQEPSKIQRVENESSTPWSHRFQVPPPCQAILGEENVTVELASVPDPAFHSTAKESAASTEVIITLRSRQHRFIAESPAWATPPRWFKLLSKFAVNSYEPWPTAAACSGFRASGWRTEPCSDAGAAMPIYDYHCRACVRTSKRWCAPAPVDAARPAVGNRKCVSLTAPAGKRPAYFGVRAQPRGAPAATAGAAPPRSDRGEAPDARFCTCLLTWSMFSLMPNYRRSVRSLHCRPAAAWPVPKLAHRSSPAWRLKFSVPG